ncbi:Hint domain-containing protein (plasmid) [Gluconobacter sphaericus]|uniref:Hint domain-containing protein n=1 Tax=Gluconobacter sphaericus TaxID=574987 RepID=UPI00192204E0|nr:Hint domain-containing protein [Gluconobacter sphaericus]QQX92786.1 Hint domain-containing protein [Gluconobacter sphaericus]
MATVTKNWTEVSQQGGTIGAPGQTTILVGSPTSAINEVTFEGNVIFNNNGKVTFEKVTISDGSSITLNSGTSITSNQSDIPSGTININGGSIKYPNAYQTSGNVVVNFGDTTSKTNNLTFNASALANVTFNNVAPGDHITISNDYNSSNEKLIDSASGKVEIVYYNSWSSTPNVVAIFNVAKKPDGTYYKASDFSISSDSASNTTTFVCFLSGTLIQTYSGLTLVEDLAIGDEVIAYVNGAEVIRRVTWAGQAHCNVHAHLPDDKAGYPVRILKDAIANGVPFKDMLITAEHCLFFEGKFVPARMLINGRSIFYDKSITSYDYYHIETEDHSVIIADGMLTESYLDTGNRRSFTQKGSVVSIGGSRNLNWEDAAAPLATDRAFVEPLFRQIEARAVLSGHDSQVPARTMVNDADLYLETENRTVIRQIRENNGRVMFMIPAGVESVRIVSNASRPCDAVGPFVDDRRILGVLVGDVRLFEGNTTATLTAHLQDADLSGWNNVEDGTMRWTGGNALLNLGQRPIGSIALMALQIHAAGPYLLADTTSERATLQA